MFKDCYASFDKASGIVRLGNSRIEKVLEIRGPFIRTVSVKDLETKKEWAGFKPLWQRCPVLQKNEVPVITFDTEVVENPYVMKPHLKVSIKLSGESGTAWYEYLIFPEISFIYNQNFVSKQGEIEFIYDKKLDEKPTGIEEEQVRVNADEIFCDVDTLDCIPIGGVHVNVNSFKLYDKTDYYDMLVEQQEVSVYIFKNGKLSRDGNVFCINDYSSKDSLMMIKHSPTESSALNRKGPDFTMQGSLYATLYGTGIDFNDIPDGKVPYYASAVGAAKTEKIHEEMWRYNTAFCTDDPRGELFIMSNTWGDRSQDMAVCESFMLKELDRAKQMGVDIIQIDDGWESGITANSRRKSGGVWEGFYADDSDFWKVNTERFPNGLEPLLAKAKNLGVEMGLWFGPDSVNDFANYEKDIETLMHFYNTYGIRYFKLDGVKIRNKVGEMRFIKMLTELTNRTKGDMRFNLDVTAEDRFGYMYQSQFGSLFVENRYTDYPNYFPHNTFKNVWSLAHVIPTRRLQMELLNTRRNTDKYEGVLFAPNTYSPDYLFATVMVANPLFWMEMSNLADEDAEKLAKISAVYKKYKKELFNSRVVPVGNRPDGANFSGYCCIGEDSTHLILFREATEENVYTFKLPINIEDKQDKLIYQIADESVIIDGNKITVHFSKKRSFVWLRLK
ncbi:MAG: alpha-galactosidase [Clostridia bacterium]|nr:alpha-galactosidase [Clostridia bacterium]